MNALEKYAAKKLLIEKLAMMPWIARGAAALAKGIGGVGRGAGAAGANLGKSMARGARQSARGMTNLAKNPRKLAVTGAAGAAAVGAAEYAKSQRNASKQTGSAVGQGAADYLTKNAPPTGSPLAKKWTNMARRNAQLTGKPGHANWSTRQTVPTSPAQSLPGVSRVPQQR